MSQFPGQEEALGHHDGVITGSWEAFVLVAGANVGVRPRIKDEAATQPEQRESDE